MKVVNIMNFVRYIDERLDDSENKLFNITKKELDLVNELGVENTFLLQYDAVCDKRYQKLFKENATDKTEIGFWYEVVEPLTTACNMEYRSERGWKWDWHINPGFSMAYTPDEREKLIDEAMRKFKEVFGFYPKTVASWLIDTHTINYLSDKYDIDAFAICRDQTNTDAYTLVGGYFNQAYYPSKNNMFTPAGSKEMQNNTPVFRLLGPCPIHNYESQKYMSEEMKKERFCPTMEAVWGPGRNPDSVDWFFKTYFENEDLGFSYMQLGQENSFAKESIIDTLRMQFEKLMKLSDVKIKKMSDTGKWFKETFDKTPATSVTALDNWDSEDVQAVYYDCRKYTASLMRYEDSIFIRSLFLFDDENKDMYLKDVCTTNDAVYENLPIINNHLWASEEKYACGLMIDSDGKNFDAKKISDGVLKVFWTDKQVVFDEEKITINADKLYFYKGNPTATIKLKGNELLYNYKGVSYKLLVKNAKIIENEKGDFEIICDNGICELYPKNIN